MGNFLAKNLQYPKPAQRANVQGKVFLSFIVRKSGEIADIQIIKGLGFGMDEEAIRIAKQMPKWIPAMQSGRAVNSKFNIPIAFVLDKESFDKAEGAEAKNYLFIIDGKEVSYETMKKMKLGKHKLTIFKDEESLRKYNAKGKSGVMIIETKK